MLRSSSDHHPGLFVTVDGPFGAGKSTVVAHLAQLLVAHGEQVHTTAEASTSAIGALARDLTDTVTGPALACLYAAHRYHHLDVGEINLGDGYVPSSLVMQRFGGVDPELLWALNSAADRTNVAIAFDADPAVTTTRLADRGPRNRFHRALGSSHAEVHFDRTSPRAPSPRRLPRTTA